MVDITDPIYQSPLESNFEGDKEVFMVGGGEQPSHKIAEGIAREVEEEIAQTTRMAMMGKRHNGTQYNSGSLDDEHRDGSPSRRHHPKFHSWRPADRD
jgi:hypothetical protein